jgi:hypothetical protein
VIFVYCTFQLLIGVEDEDSCGKSELGETPQAKPRSSPTARGKRSLPRKSTAVFTEHITINIKITTEVTNHGTSRNQIRIRKISYYVSGLQGVSLT